MNRPIRVLAVGCFLLLLALMGRATYLQFFDAGHLGSVVAYPNNTRAVDEAFDRQRGAIIVAGKPIAESVPTKGKYKYQRVYPAGPEYAQITGYFSLGYGLGGIEATENNALIGNDSQVFLNRLSDILQNKPTPGENVVLTLNPAAQLAAYNGLKGKIGAVVAIEPSTGKILAMASTPTYDPNTLALQNQSQVAATKTKLLDETPSPLNNIAIQTILPPGSTFKMVTAAAALSTGKYTPSSPVNGAATMQLPLSTTLLPNDDGPCPALNGSVDLMSAFAFSCNVAFGTIAEQIGNAAIANQAQKFGFGQKYFSDLNDGLVSQSVSQFPSNADAPGTVLASIGQGNTAATPLQMALVAAGIANGGTVMKPYLVNEIDAANLDVVSQTNPQPLNDEQPAISPQVDQELTQMMVAVVDNGTGTAAKIPGIQVAGKTGTAQSSASRPPYAWFASFAPATNAKVAVAVLIQTTPGVAASEVYGGTIAAPIAKAVMEAVINSQ